MHRDNISSKSKIFSLLTAVFTNIASIIWWLVPFKLFYDRAVAVTVHCFVSAPHLPVKEPTAAANEWRRFPQVKYHKRSAKLKVQQYNRWNPTAHCIGSTFTCTEKLNGVPINPKTAGKVFLRFWEHLRRNFLEVGSLIPVNQSAL